MNAQSKDPADHHEEPSPTAATAPEPNSNLQDIPASAEAGDAQAASPEMPPPIDVGTGEDADAQTSPEPDATTPPKKSKKAKTTTEAKAKRAKTKTAGANRRAAEEPSDAGDAAKGMAEDEGAPVLACLQRAYIEPAALPPAATLPPKLTTLFRNMLSVSTLLAVTAAAAGHGVRLNPCKNGGGDSSSLALRVVIVGEERGLPPAVSPVLHGAYALEARDVQSWKADKMIADMKGAAAAGRQRICQQLVANAGLLGLAELPDSLNSMIVAASADLPRPCFVLRNPVQTKVRRGLEVANQGALVVDSRRMPTMSGFGVNYDEVTADLLNAAAAGDAFELADPCDDGSVRMRPLAVSVIGTLSIIDSYGLYKAGAPALAATVFVPAKEKTNPNSVDAILTLTEILGRVRAFATNPLDSRPSPRLSTGARKAFNQAKVNFMRTAASVLPPLSDYYAAAADLACRIAVVLHILDHAASGEDKMSAEVGKGVVLRAIAFVEQCVLPAARSALALASVAPEVRHARRIISFAQQYASAAFPLLVRREVIRILQRSMSVATIDRAIRRLVADGLLAASNPDAAKGGGHLFQVHPVVFDTNNQLPDLVTDPRRSKP